MAEKGETENKKGEFLRILKLTIFVLLLVALLFLIMGGLDVFFVMLPLIPIFGIIILISNFILETKSTFKKVLILMITYIILFHIVFLIPFFNPLHDPFSEDSNFTITLLKITPLAFTFLLLAIFGFDLTDIAKHYNIGIIDILIFILAFLLSNYFVSAFFIEIKYHKSGVYNYGILAIFFIFILLVQSLRYYRIHQAKSLEAVSVQTDVDHDG